MAAFAFDSYRNHFWGGAPTTRIDFDTDTTIRLIFIDHGNDTPAVTDDFLDDLLTASWCPTTIAGCPAITGGTIGSPTVGTIDAIDTVFTSLAAGSTPNVESLVMFKDVSNTASTSPLMLRWDSTAATGLPLTPNGANVTVAWNSSGIATIG